MPNDTGPKFFTTQSRVDFVLDVDHFIEAEGKSIQEAVGLAKGDGTVEDYQTWKGLLHYTKPIQQKFSSGNSVIDGLVNAIQYLMSTSLFFISLGLGVIYWAINIHADKPPSFIFLLTVLGSASFLYGTGTQIVGRVVSPKNTIGFWGTFTIFGGAGVLAAFIGFAIAIWPDKIREAFLPQYHYVKMNVPAKLGESGSSDITSDTVVRVRLAGGDWLPAYANETGIHFFLPRKFGSEFCHDYVVFHVGMPNVGKAEENAEADDKNPTKPLVMEFAQTLVMLKESDQQKHQSETGETLPSNCQPPMGAREVSGHRQEDTKYASLEKKNEMWTNNLEFQALASVSLKTPKTITKATTTSETAPPELPKDVLESVQKELIIDNQFE